MLKYIKNFSIIHILFLSLIARIFSFYLFGDESLVNEWAKIIHNKKISGLFGYYVVINDYFADPKFAEYDEIVLPTVFMPPLYSYYIYMFELIPFENFTLSDLVIISQILISLITIYIFYKLVHYFEKEDISLVSTAVFAFFPLNVWVSSQISSITIQIFLIVCFLFYLVKFQEEKNTKYLILFSLLSGFLILIRGEFLLFYFFTIVYFFIILEKKFKNLILSLFFTILIISPYIYRNYSTFNELTLTKSFGYNLLKGNNPNLIVEGDAVFLEEEFDRKKLKIRANENYEINLDNYYKDKALQYILDDPNKYFIFYTKKVLSFLFIDFNSSYPNYYNPLHIIPKIILSILTFIGCFLMFKKNSFYQYLIIYYSLNILLFSVFFILPRYSLILLPIQILISVGAVKFFWQKFVNKLN